MGREYPPWRSASSTLGSMHELYLKKSAERRLSRGHPWVYSNEIDVERSPLKGLEAGIEVAVLTAGGNRLGSGHASPGSLVCVRLLARGNTMLDGLIDARIAKALAWRERAFPEPYYRLVFAEGDNLPGLVIDRFGDELVVQISTWGMEVRRQEIVLALDAHLSPKAIHFDDSSTGRRLEGLPGPEGDESSAGSQSPRPRLARENGVDFVLPRSAQKTGWYYDQRDNRAQAVRWFKGQRVLDLYSYAGGWGIQAAYAGAASVLCVDSSAAALEAASATSERGGFGIECQQSKVEGFLAAAAESNKRWDLVVLDPPALIKRKKDINKGTTKYRALTRQALQVIEPGGMLVSCSCSMHLDRIAHLAMVRAAARGEHRQLRVIAEGGMPADHPTHAQLPESRYLSCWYFLVD